MALVFFFFFFLVGRKLSLTTIIPKRACHVVVAEEFRPDALDDASKAWGLGCVVIS